MDEPIEPDGAGEATEPDEVADPSDTDASTSLGDDPTAPTAADEPAAPTPPTGADHRALGRLVELDATHHAGRRRRRRLSKWDRPRRPRDWRWWVGGVGKVLISVGVLMFAFVAYQLWGTAIEEAQAQDRLENEFEDLLASAATAPTTTVAPTTVPPPTSSTVPGASTTTSTSTSTTAAPPPVEINEGDPIAVIDIPRIGVFKYVVAGVETADLKKGPGHYPFTPMPGQLGNAAIAGHRTTYGEPFRHLDELQPGDEIRVRTLTGAWFTYRVTGSEVVSPADSYVLATTDFTKATLTLTTCHPEFSAKQRLIVYSELDTSISPPPGGQVINYGRTEEDRANDEPTGDDPTISAPVDDTVPDGVIPGDEPTEPTDEGITVAADADAFNRGWFSDPGAWPQVALWGTVLSLVAIGAYLLSRSLRRNWVGLLVGIVPFVVVLYFFFQNVNRLLPPNL